MFLRHNRRGTYFMSSTAVIPFRKDLPGALGIRCTVPMSDHPVRTLVKTDEGTLTFQRYYVQRQCEPKVRSFEFSGIKRAYPHVEFMNALKDPALVGVIICPSNPFVSCTVPQTGAEDSF